MLTVLFFFVFFFFLHFFRYKALRGDRVHNKASPKQTPSKQPIKRYAVYRRHVSELIKEDAGPFSAH